MKKQPERYMQPFNKISSGLDISLALKELQDNCHLFGELEHRGQPGSPHAQMKDIWLRYGDTTQLIESGDYSILGGEHDSVWLKDLPHCKRLCYEVMSMVDGERRQQSSLWYLPASRPPATAPSGCLRLSAYPLYRGG